jgi:hypothetical protein
MTFLNLPTTREDARANGSARYFTGKPCRNGHVSPRRVTDGVCIGCSQQKNRKDSARMAEYNRQYRATRAEKIKRAMREYYLKNRALYYSFNRLRRAQRRCAQPAWVDTKAVSSFYQQAMRLSSEHGIKYHVDHIIPLRGKNVCGLHVPWNLRIIPASENLSKGNKFQQGVDY